MDAVRDAGMPASALVVLVVTATAATFGGILALAGLLANLLFGK
jgi:hypothetical protein